MDLNHDQWLWFKFVSIRCENYDKGGGYLHCYLLSTCFYPFLYHSIHHYSYHCFYPLFYHSFHPFFDRHLKLGTFQKSSWNGNCCRTPSKGFRDDVFVTKKKNWVFSKNGFRMTAGPLVKALCRSIFLRQARKIEYFPKMNLKLL